MSKAVTHLDDEPCEALFDPETFLALRSNAAFSSRKTRSNSSGYPGHVRPDFRHWVQVGRISSH